MSHTRRRPAIVYTIAGSDSGGGAGIQADLHTIHSLSGGQCHGCSAITCLTAQNSQGVTAVHSPPVHFLREQLACLEKDLYPNAVKVGMLGTTELAEEVGEWISKLRNGNNNEVPLIVVDPVMISTSGHRLIDEDAKAAIIEKVFPYADLVTPNKFEAEELLGRKLTTPQDVETGAREILAMGPKAVLIKGGHLLTEQNDGAVQDDVPVPVSYAEDYLLTNEDMSDIGKPVKDKARLCDGSRGVWFRGIRYVCLLLPLLPLIAYVSPLLKLKTYLRYDTIHTHGTGCTLSSAIATSWAMGQSERSSSTGCIEENIGALKSMHLIDACCIAKAYVNAGIECGVQVRYTTTNMHFRKCDYTKLIRISSYHRRLGKDLGP